MTRYMPDTRLSMVAIVIAGLAALLLSANIARADLTVATDDFEDYQQGPTGSGWLDEWVFSGDVEYKDSGQPHSGQSHLRLRGDGAEVVRSAEITGESSLHLRLWAKPDDLQDSEAEAFIEVSSDGSSYTQLGSWDEDEEEEYAFFDFDLSATGLTFTTQIWVRARVTGNEEDEGDLFIDDIELVNTGGDPDPPPDPGISPITVDGQFDDWSGKANITDASGDQSGSSRRDIAAFYWANNIDEGVNYHMIERHTKDGQPLTGSNGQSWWARYIVYIDANNNGNYTDGSDRRAVVTYVPTSNSSFVNVKVYPANSSSKISDSGWNDWGDSRNDGGLRVEFALDWDDLGISFGGVIRMYAVSFTGLSSSPGITDRAPDGNADIQWSPASVLGTWLLAGAAAAGMGLIFFLSRRRRLWT